MTSSEDDGKHTIMGVISVHLAKNDATGKYGHDERTARWATLRNPEGGFRGVREYAKRYPQYWPQPQYTLVGFYEPVHHLDDWTALFDADGFACSTVRVDSGRAIIQTPRMFDAVTELPLYFLHGQILTLPVT